LRSDDKLKVCRQKNEAQESLLNLICVIAAGGFFASHRVYLNRGGSIISTDGLFFIVVRWCCPGVLLRFREWIIERLSGERKRQRRLCTS